MLEENASFPPQSLPRPHTHAAGAQDLKVFNNRPEAAFLEVSPPAPPNRGC